MFLAWQTAISITPSIASLTIKWITSLEQFVYKLYNYVHLCWSPCVAYGPLVLSKYFNVCILLFNTVGVWIDDIKMTLAMVIRMFYFFVFILGSSMLKKTFTSLLRYLGGEAGQNDQNSHFCVENKRALFTIFN